MSELTRAQVVSGPLAWTPSIYFAESVVFCPLDYAWKALVNYEKWNPTFVGAQVQPVRGEWRRPGELVLIRKLDIGSGDSAPEFYAETVVVTEPRRIIWYVYPVEGYSFRNFVDFGLSELASGVRFSINYYAQSPRNGELSRQEQEALEQLRAQGALDMQNLAGSFKNYCETHVNSST